MHMIDVLDKLKEIQENYDNEDIQRAIATAAKMNPVEEEAVAERKDISHSCVNHFEHKKFGNGTVIPGEHTLSEDGEVSHYDAKFVKEDSSTFIVRNIPVANIQEIISEKHHSHKKKISAGQFDEEVVDEGHTPPELQDILDAHEEEYMKFKAGAELHSLESFYNDLYDYFVNSGEMPYGTAKARTGDPDQWIADYLDSMDDPYAVGENTVEEVHVEENNDLADIVKLAGRKSVLGLNQNVTIAESTELSEEDELEEGTFGPHNLPNAKKDDDAEEDDADDSNDADDDEDEDKVEEADGRDLTKHGKYKTDGKIQYNIAGEPIPPGSMPQDAVSFAGGSTKPMPQTSKPMPNTSPPAPKPKPKKGGWTAIDAKKELKDSVEEGKMSDINIEMQEEVLHMSEDDFVKKYSRYGTEDYVRSFWTSAHNESIEEEAIEETVEVPLSELADLLRLAGYENYEEKLSEYENDPEEKYFDVEDQLIGLAGGLNRPKTMHPTVAGGDNPLAVIPIKVDEADMFEKIYQNYQSFIKEAPPTNKASRPIVAGGMTPDMRANMQKDITARLTDVDVTQMANAFTGQVKERPAKIFDFQTKASKEIADKVRTHQPPPDHYNPKQKAYYNQQMAQAEREMRQDTAAMPQDPAEIARLEKFAT